MVDLWDIYQHHQISEQGRRIDDARSSAESARRELERRLDKLALVNMAMWSILRDKLGVTDAELEDRARAIDLLDGVLDGRAAPAGQQCPRCKRTMSIRHRRCLYCGEVDLTPSPF